jgi:hypothetical protein
MLEIAYLSFKKSKIFQGAGDMPPDSSRRGSQLQWWTRLSQNPSYGPDLLAYDVYLLVKPMLIYAGSCSDTHLPTRTYPDPPLNSPQLHILKRGSVIWTWKYWILELLLKLGIYLANLCFYLCSFCCKGILEFSTLYFIYFAPSAHLVQRWNLFQTSNFNTAHFRIQYCTLFIQYCTKCAILHTKIGPGKRPNHYTIEFPDKF